jgi:hypothetical protein
MEEVRAMDFHIPSLTTMNDVLAFGRLGASRGEGRTFGKERLGYSDRSRIEATRPSARELDDTLRIITPSLPKAGNFWTTADITSVNGRDVWTIDAPQRCDDEEGLAFFCFDLEAPRDIGFTMSMRAADPGPSAFEIVVTGHVVSRHYTVIDRFITRTFTVPAAVLNAGRNALSISAIPGYHGIWIESAGIGPLA